MRNGTPTTSMPTLPQPRMVAGEWRCLDCGHLSYGDAIDPRCPNCYSARLVPTLDQRPRDDQPRLATR
jgi:rubrerythrin